MKKVSRILIVAAIAIAMMINGNFANFYSNESGIDLAALISLSIVNAEQLASNCRYSGNSSDTCTQGVYTIRNCYKRNPPYIANCYY